MHRTALVLYGSETGDAQDVAEEIGRLAERLRFDATVVDLDSVQLRDLLGPTVIIFSVSTTGQGEMPQNARAFWKKLLSGALQPGILRRVRFTSFGLGDSSYARFNVAHRMLNGRLLQLGAQAFCDRGEGNGQHPEGHSAGFREWRVILERKLLETFPLPDGLEPVPEDIFLEPKWKLGSSFLDGPANDTALSEKPELSSQVPSQELVPIKSSHTADIDTNDRITASDHFQDVRLINLHLDAKWDYGPGAIAVVYPKNFPSDVQEFIDLMGWQSTADTPLVLQQNAASSAGATQALPPLRDLDLSGVKLTMRWLLENVFDIMSVPRRSFFASLVHFARENTEDEKYQKERLLELANPELIDELWDYTTRPRRTILEVMMDFTTVHIPWEYSLSVLPIMKGRQFSIASGGSLRRSEDGRTRIQLLVAIANPPSPIIKWRRRYGVCTRYMAILQAGERINIGLQEGYLNVRPGELDVPAVMIGPGTGLAPMRSMVNQRLLWARVHNPVDGEKKLEKDILIFGCRNEQADYFFKPEWESFEQSEGLTVLTAFSRDSDKPKQYVQDKIRENSRQIYEAIVTRHGKVYVCGSSGNMPKGVRQALLDALVAQGQQLDETSAESYLAEMEKQGRYKQETW